MVIDSTDRERLAVTREELYRMLQHEDLSKASLLVYANKQVSVKYILNYVFLLLVINIYFQFLTFFMFVLIGFKRLNVSC